MKTRKALQWVRWIVLAGSVGMLLAGCGGGKATPTPALGATETAIATRVLAVGATETAVAARVLATLTAEARVTPTPSAQVEAVAQQAFEAWAKQQGEPYRDVVVQVEESDSYFARVRVVAWFRPGMEAPWEEREAAAECRKVGEEWQCDEQLAFALTAGERQRQAALTATAAAVTATVVAAERATAVAAAAATATAVAIERATIEAQRQATAIAEAATATAVAAARATTEAVTATAVAIERATADTEAMARSPWTNPTDDAVYVYVPSGEFTMGSADSDPDERPQHMVFLDGFWIMQTEVTNAMYARCVQAGACTPPGDSRWQDDAYADHPVVYVGWGRAGAYCQWAGGRLPTEAEWEKAARGTDGRKYPWGNDWDPDKLNSAKQGPGDTTPVGSYPDGTSPYGALDMAGNVWEWTSSLYESYPYDAGDGREDPASGGVRVLRGGSWVNNGRLVRSANRDGNEPGGSYGLVGFRCARSP